MKAIEHLGCGGSLVEAMVPYCGKCGKSKASVLKENDKFTEKVRTGATAESKWEGPPPTKYNPKEQIDVDHRPIRSKESARAHEIFDEITRLRYSSGGIREEKGTWAQIYECAKKGVSVAKEDGDVFCFNKTRGILHYAETILKGDNDDAPRIKKEKQDSSAE